MKRFLTMAVVGVMALGLSSVAYANYCSTDAVPAATLLFPFVQYDYEGGFEGETTVFSITNVSSDAQIVHITVWSDYSVAILDFNLTLTGYDVARLNIRDILGTGHLPTEDPTGTGGLVRTDNIWSTLNAGGTPFDDGPYSTHNELHNPAITINNLADPQATAPALNCDPAVWVSSPVNYVDPIDQDTLNLFQGYLQASMAGNNSYWEDCSGSPGSVTFPDETWFVSRTDGPTWLYITADVVGACNKDLPDNQAATYFSTARTEGVLDNNVLIGDVIWLNQTDRYSEADNAVHLESDPAAGGTTFYQRYLVAGTADYREPLPTAWAFRYQINEDAGINTWIRAFKASSNFRTVPDLGSSTTNFGNITTPGPSALYANACIPYTYYAWDEDEQVNSFSSSEDPWSGGLEDPIRPVPNILPLETQEVEAGQFFLVGQSDGDAFGWLMFVWPSSNGHPAEYQTWMGVKYSGFGDYTAGLSGAVLANYNCDNTQVLPGLGIGLYSE